MRHLVLSLIIIVSASCIHARSYNEHIAAAMNTGNWLALDSIYRTASRDSILPFLEVYSRGLIGNRLNRPDISIPAFEELLQSHTSSLDLSNMLNSAVMLSMDLSKTGDNASASAVITSMLDASRQYLDSAAIAGMQQYIDIYTALSAYNPYTISFENDKGRIPFRFVSVGNPKKKSVLMQLDNSSINGIKTEITFDTGAGVNIISDSLAMKLNLIMTDAYNTVAGIGRRKARYAIAKEMRIGDITVTDVPFLVLDMSTGNAEANQYMDCLNIIAGSELMLHLKDITIDFINREITVPSVAPTRSDTPANMCMSQSMNLITKVIVNNDRIWTCIDTGDSSFGYLNGTFFENNKEYVTANAVSDTIRTAGIGGIHIAECYRLGNVDISLGGETVTVPDIVVNLDKNPIGADYEFNIGLKSLMRFGRIRFNMVDFTISAESGTQPSDTDIMPGHTAFTFKKEKAPTMLQTIGFVATAIANGLLNTNAPAPPDL